MSEVLTEDQKTIIILKQKLAVLGYEFREISKAVDRHRREFATPIYVPEFGREVTLDFDDPLYPYCPFRLRKEELKKFQKKGGEDVKK